mmetsp:Transcript_107751/g.310260  ORF Transcript_107751/g.310260 Transcript_107751/m.310260 type:complete len:511 (-) Transcript_107751:41-1573(-)
MTPAQLQRPVRGRGARPPAAGATAFAAVLALAALALHGCGPPEDDPEDDPRLPAACQVGSTCRLKLSAFHRIVRPAQPVVGFAAVYNTYDRAWEGRTADEIQAMLDRSPTPVVIGPGDAPYVVDGHHRICALDLWASEPGGSYDVEITLEVLCNHSAASDKDFEQFMKNSASAYLLDRRPGAELLLPRNVSLADLPKRFEFNRNGSSQFRDDAFRSLATFVRFVRNEQQCSNDGEEAFCRRGYLSECDENHHQIPFYEFNWAYFLNEASQKMHWWSEVEDGTRRFLEFYQLLRDLIIDKDRETFHRQKFKWDKAATIGVLICRTVFARNFTLPRGQFGFSGLPGVVEFADQTLPPDPVCHRAAPPAECRKPEANPNITTASVFLAFAENRAAAAAGAGGASPAEASSLTAHVAAGSSSALSIAGAGAIAAGGHSGSAGRRSRAASHAGALPQSVLAVSVSTTGGLTAPWPEGKRGGSSDAGAARKTVPLATPSRVDWGAAARHDTLMPTL